MIRKSVHKTILLAVINFVTVLAAYAQYGSEDELKEAANKMFEEEKYVEALPLFSQLLSNYPKDLNYNYKYGACVLYGSKEKDKALKYLKFSVSKSTVNPIAYYFLAKAYHHNYEFSPAIVYYNKFKEKGSSKDIQRLNVDRDIEMCKNGENLIKSMTDIGVLSKKDIKRTDFFRTYDLKGIGGKIIVKPDEFKTKLDKKKKESSIIYLGEKRDMVVFSSYGANGSNGKDIYKVVKLPGGEWSKPSLLEGQINTPFDEDYPYLHPDGRTLYFSSKGYNSMGGYDVFKSTKDPVTGQWGFPENLDFPINTPDDDILFISDIDNQLAYFASSRSSKQGELTVYRVTVDAPPVENSVIKGFFLAEANTSMRDATITIRDAEKDRRYGVYKTHSETGEYLLVFPKNGGKFKILVETTSDAPIHSASIELPVLDSFRALKQELRLVGQGDDEKLVVKNLFDETDEFDIHDPLVVQHILKQRANLDVNTTEEEVMNSGKAIAENTTSTENESSEFKNLSDEQLVNETDKVAEELLSQTEMSKQQANTAFQKASVNSVKAKELYAESEKLREEAESTDDDNEKQQKLALAEAKKYEAADLVNKTVAALNVARILESETTERESDVAAIKSLQEKINSNIDNGNRVEAEKNLKELNEIASATYHEKSALETENELTEEALFSEKDKYNKARDRVTELTNRDYELEETVNKLEAKKAATKKKSEKQDIDARIQALAIDIEDTKYELENAKKKEAAAKLVYEEKKNEILTTQKVIAEISDESSNNSSSNITDNNKLQIENDISYFEKEGLVGIYPDTENSLIVANDTYDLKEYKDDYEIIDENGEIEDYSTKYSVALTEVDNISNPNEKSLEIIKVNQEWIASIDEEIEIRENQLKVTDNEVEKDKLQSRVTSLKILKTEKQNEIEEQSTFVADNTTTDNTTSETDNVNTNNAATDNTETVETEIMNTDGTIKDYQSEFTTELENIPEEETYEAYTQKAAVHEKWAVAAEQEVLIRKMELTEADDSEKEAIENKIAVLENDIAEQREFAALYEIQAEAMATDNELATTDNTENENTSSETNTTETNNETTTSNENEVAENNETETNTAETDNESTTDNTNTNEVINNDYQSTYTNELENIGEEETVEAYTQKAAIHEKWAVAAEEQLATKKTALESADGTEKETLENEVAILENEIAEQREFAALYEIQAEAMATDNELATTDNTENDNTSTETNTNEIENESTTTSTETESATNNNNTTVTTYELTSDKLNAEEDNFSNLKYYEGFEYKSDASQESMASVQQLKSEARTLKDEADIKLNEAASTSSQDRKEELIDESDKLVVQSQEKQEQIARVYETANRKEYQNNQQAIEELKKSNSDEFSNQSIMIDLLEEEANNYYAEAQSERERAINANNFTVKEVALQKAYELEMKAIDRQNKAIAQLGDEGVTEDIYAANETDNTNENNTARIDNTTNETETDTETTTSNENEVAENNEIETNTTETDNEAEIENVTADDVVLTEEDKELILNLSPLEIEAIKDSEDYQEYAELKKENRRLTKEAEVEYVEAEKYEEEANDQKQLELSLKALASAASSEEDKVKKEEQLQKLKLMIEENEAKSEALKTSAAQKEQEAAAAKEKTDFILINAEEDAAKNMAAIEKAESSDTGFMANAMSRTADTEVDNSSSENNENELATTDNTTETENNTTSDTIENETNTNGNEENEIATETENNEVATTDNTENENTSTETNNETNASNENEVTENNETETNTNETDTETTTSNENEVAENNETEVNANTVTDNESTTENTTDNASTATSATLDNINEVPAVLNQSIFIVNNNNQAVYNDNNPIPTVDKLPEGVVFKVQIGAFRNPIPQNHFKGFAPIAAEDAGNGITRYTAGLFNSFNMANEAKNSIRSIGYGDAFVVAFYNGKRISVSEARTMINEEAVADNSTINENNTSESIDNEATSDNTATDTETTSTEIETEEVRDGVSTDVRNIDGVFYAIQVGVYSKPVTAGQLNNVSPLNSERLASGLIRYTSGVFKTLAEANTAKDRIRGLGISDAFVVAYNGGQKITVTQANQMLSGSNTSENNTETNNSEQPEENEVTPNTNEENATEIDSESNTELENESTNTNEIEEDNTTDVVSGVSEELNLEFKVKLGEYEEDVPVEDAGLFLQLTGRGVKNYEENGKTIYTIGSFSDYQSALDMQIEMQEMGVKDPQTIAFKDGEQIEIEEALELIKNNQ